MTGVKRSRQREVILEILRGTKAHPSAERIYSEARKRIPNISLGTVYRNLALLVRGGEVQRLEVGGECDHFDADLRPHYHFVCRSCGRIEDLPLPYDAQIDALAEQNVCGGTVTHHALCFYGFCRDCAPSGACGEKE